MPKKLKFDLSFDELVALEGWYGDPKKLFSNLETHKLDSIAVSVFVVILVDFDIHRIREDKACLP